MSISAITGSSTAYSSTSSQSVTNGQGTVLAADSQSSAARTIDTDEVSIVALDQNPASQPPITQDVISPFETFCVWLGVTQLL